MPTLPVSVVIIAFNAAATIRRTLEAACKLSNDVVVLDSGSTDATGSIVSETGARLICMEWKGYGYNKNKGNELAMHDWIVSIDADEELSDDLISSIGKVDLADINVAFKVKRLNFLNDQPIYHGEWKDDWTLRFFNRKIVRWNDAPVHENLLLPASIEIRKLQGWLYHYTAPDIDKYKQKMDKYAGLMAQKYALQGKKAGTIKVYAAPVFNFLKHYLFKAGWLDKRAGWQIAVANARYTFRKYKLLHDLKEHKNPGQGTDSL